MTTEETELPREIEDFLRRQIASHDQLKLLLLMSDEPTRWWTLEQLGQVVGGRMADVVETLDPLIGGGLLVCRATRLEALYRFAPTRATDALLVARLRELDAQRSPVLLPTV